MGAVKKLSEKDLPPGFTGHSVDAVHTDCSNSVEVCKGSEFVAELSCSGKLTVTVFEGIWLLMLWPPFPKKGLPYTVT